MTLNQALAIRIRELLNENKMSQYIIEGAASVRQFKCNADFIGIFAVCGTAGKNNKPGGIVLTVLNFWLQHL